MELKEILESMSKKYPSNLKNGIYPALLIYDDESGHIVKNTMLPAHDNGNDLFAFMSIDELVAHLQEKV